MRPVPRSDPGGRRRHKRLPGPWQPAAGLLALGGLAALAAVPLALLAPGRTIAGLPLWDAALATAVLALLAYIGAVPGCLSYREDRRPARRVCDRRHRRRHGHLQRGDGSLLAVDRRLREPRRRASHDRGSGAHPARARAWPLAVHRGRGRFEGRRTARRNSHSPALSETARRPRGWLRRRHVDGGG